MEISIKLHAIKSEWSLEVSKVKISPQNIAFLSLKMNSVLPNSADPDEMPHYVAFHLSLH